MLFAGWEVHIVKNCDRGLENAVRARMPRAQFFTVRTDPKSGNKFFYSAKKLVYKCRVCLRNFVIESAYAPFTNHSQKI